MNDLFDEENTERRYRALARWGASPETIATLRDLLFMQPDHVAILCSVDIDMIESKISSETRNAALIALAEALSRGRRQHRPGSPVTA
jgi:hypothetical protein